MTAEDLCKQCGKAIPEGAGRYVSGTSDGQVCLACHDKK
jgi:ribosomal protein L24E